MKPITEAFATIDRELWDTPPEVNAAIATLREALADRLAAEDGAAAIAAELAREDL